MRHSVLALAGMAAAIAPAFAASPALSADDLVRLGDRTWHRSEWRASTFTPSTQGEAALTVLDGGGALVTWSSRRQQEGSYGVHAQRFDVHGAAVGTETAVNLWRRSHQLEPAIDDRGGGTWIAWQSHRQDGHAGSIVARRMASDGPGGDEILVNRAWEGHQSDPILAGLPDGGAVVLWHHRAPDAAPAAPLELRLQRLSAEGEHVGEEQVLPTAGHHARTPAMAVSGDGRLAIVHGEASGTDGRPTNIRLTVLGADGAPAGEPTIVSDDAGAGPIEPAIAATPGGWVVAWIERGRAGDDFRVRLRRLAPDGTPAGPSRGVRADGLGSQVAAALAVAPDGRLAVGFNAPDGDGRGVFARLFDAAGEPIGGAIRLTAHLAGDQALHPARGTKRLAFDADGRLWCAWNGDGGLGDASAVHCTMLTPVERSADLVAIARTHQGVHPGMHPAPFANEDVTLVAGGPAPHVPPTFDPRRIDDGVRETVAGLRGELGFTGVFDTGWNPPDPHLAVGPNHLVVMTNGKIAFFTKDGTLTFEDEIEDGFGFWGPVGATGFVFDPEVLFDTGSGRFFAMAAEAFAPGNRSYALVAVSDDSDPNGTWYKYRFETTSLAGDLFDSPNMGVDPDTLYITGDGFGLGSNYPVFTFDKASLLAGDPPAITRQTTLSTGTQSAGIPPVIDEDLPAYYMVEHRESGSNSSVRMIALTDPLGSPTFQSTSVAVPTYTSPPEFAPQSGTTSRANTFDVRFWSATYANGSLWATHHVGSDRVLVRWYQFALNGWPASGSEPTLVQSGEVDPGAGIRTFFSAISADDDGNAALVYSRSSTSEFFSMETTFRVAGDPPGFMNEGTQRAVANAPFFGGRWGDYAAIEFDPFEPGRVWAHHEYADGGSWRTWVQSFRTVTPPANDRCADGPTIGFGATPLSTVGATTDGPAESGCGDGPLSDVWYKFVADCDQDVTVSVCDADFDAAVAVYLVSCPQAPDSAVACSTEGCPGGASVTFSPNPGFQYRVRVGSTDGSTGTATVEVTCGSDACVGDVDGSDSVDTVDLLALLAAWGACPGCPEDLDGSGAVDTVDLLALLAAWGPC